MHSIHAVCCFKHSTRSASSAAPVAQHNEPVHSQFNASFWLNPRAYDSSLDFPTATERHVYPTVLERPPLPMHIAIRPLLPASAFQPRLAPPGIGSGKLRSMPSGCAIGPPVPALHQAYYVVYSQVAVPCTHLLLVWKAAVPVVLSVSMYCCAV